MYVNTVIRKLRADSFLRVGEAVYVPLTTPPRRARANVSVDELRSTCPQPLAFDGRSYVVSSPTASARRWKSLGRRGGTEGRRDEGGETRPIVELELAADAPLVRKLEEAAQSTRRAPLVPPAQPPSTLASFSETGFGNEFDPGLLAPSPSAPAHNPPAALSNSPPIDLGEEWTFALPQLQMHHKINIGDEWFVPIDSLGPRYFRVDTGRTWLECDAAEVDTIYSTQKFSVHDTFFLYALKGRMFFEVSKYKKSASFKHKYVLNTSSIYIL